MHGQLLRHVAKRSVEIASDNLNQPSFQPQIQHGNEPQDVKLPKFGVAVIASTFMAFLLMISLVRYTLWGVISTLTMVEQPQTHYIVKEEKGIKADDKVTAEEAIDTDVLVIKQKPVTSKIRATIHHLQARGGFSARWRGIAPFSVYIIMQGILTEFLGHAIPLPLGCGRRIIGSAMASVLLLRLSTAWVHIVISEPSTKTWFRRIPSLKAFKVLWLPTVLTDLSFNVSSMVPMLVLLTCRLHRPSESLDHREVTVAAAKLLSALVISVVCFVGIAVPSAIALTRMQASMLPEEHESIVPFDRSFGGRLVPEVLGGTGALTMKEAWQTFDKQARLRYIKFALKSFLVDVALHVLFALTIATQIYYFIGTKNIEKLVRDHHHE